MRRNSVRKFIHALVDLLPLFIIPIFAININQKSVEPISIEVQEQVSVNFNQQAHVETLTDLTTTYYGVDITRSNNQITLLGTPTTNVYSYMSVASDVIEGHKYLLKSNWSGNIAPRSNTWQVYTSGVFARYEIDSVIITSGASGKLWFQFAMYANNNLQVTFTYQCFDLTQMGLENITITEFNTMFPDNIYDYTESQKMLVNKPSPTTYDDTDIGSQFLYSLYKPINDYFNFNNLFNMNDVWNWIQLNLFQGTAPLPVFMVWNIMIYEFFVDLIFLLYAVFMFIIDWSTGLIDKFLGRSRT